MNHAATFRNWTWLLLAALLLGNPALAANDHNTKMTSALRAVARAVESGNADALMQAALTRQLFRENGPLAARWNAGGQVQIYIHYDRSAVTPDITALQQLGATDIRAAQLLGVVQAWAPAGQLTNVAALPWVQRLTVPQYALAAPTQAAITRVSSAPPSVDQFLGAAAFRKATGDTGQGVMVGVISSGAAGVSQSQSVGDLPANVWVDPSLPGDSSNGAGGEGTAMMEIVHTLAPGAELAFCGPNTTAEFLNCLTDLQQHGAQIIVDDQTYPVTAYFTNDSDVTAVQQWQAQNPSVRLVTAAGNFATSFWSGTYTPLTITPTTINGVTYTQANNFGTNANPNPYMDINVAPGQLAYVLEWDDPWVPSAKVTSTTPNDPNDYDLILYDANGNVLACSQGVTGDQNGCNQAGAAASATPGPQPIMGNEWTNTSSSAVVNVKLAIYYRAGTPGTALKLFVASPNSCEVLINPVNPVGSIVGHAALPYPAMITVGALYGPDALNNQYALEQYSSQGPVNLPLLTSTPIQKPDFVGVDGVSVSGAGGFPPAGCGQPAPNPPVFYGTSAAAPDVAALIALLESAGYTSDQVYGVLQSHSIGLAASGGTIPNGMFGYGLPDIATVKAAAPPPPSPPISPSKSSGGGGIGLLGLVCLMLGAGTKRRLCRRGRAP